MKKYILILSVISFLSMSFKTDKPAYLLYDQSGKKASYSDMVDELKKADIVFFGELHTDPIAHWLQLELTKDFYSEMKEKLVLAAEMFESDNQVVLTEYMESRFNADKFEADARLWKNYKTDYKPVVEFAKENHLTYVASNIPRRYASIVHQSGFEGLENLSDQAKAFIAPLPINYDPEVKCYKDMMSMEGMGGHVNENFPKAQAAKDATMAYFIMQNWSKGKLVFHFNGSYHSNNFEGIVWHLNQQNKNLKIMTIATVYQSEIDKLSDDNKNLANYIICIPDNMTQTSR